MKINERFNPLLPSAAYMQRSAKILISIQEEIIKNFESIFAYDSKNEKKERIQAVKGENTVKVFNFFKISKVEKKKSFNFCI